MFEQILDFEMDKLEAHQIRIWCFTFKPELEDSWIIRFSCNIYSSNPRTVGTNLDANLVVGKGNLICNHMLLFPINMCTKVMRTCVIKLGFTLDDLE